MSKFPFDRSEGAAVNNMKIYFRVSVAIAILAAVLRSVAFVTSFDYDIGYFDSSFLPTATHWLIAIACAFALSGFFFINNKATFPNKLESSPNSVFFASIFAGFIMAADFAYKVYTMVGEDKFEYYSVIFKKGFRAENAYLVRATAVIEIFGALSALLAAVWFFLRSSKKPNARLCAAFGFFPVLRALSGISTVYFDMNVQMNHPSKLVLQFALIAIMFCFLCEQRFFVSENHPRPRRFFISACAAGILGVSVGVSEIFGFLTGKLSKGTFCIEAFFCLTVSVYILARAASFVKDAEGLATDNETTSASAE